MNGEPILTVVFFRNDAEREPVREWIIDCGENGKKTIGEEIKTVQFSWPKTPRSLVKRIKGVTGLSRLRSRFRQGRQQARILFTVEGNKMILFHGFFKQGPNISNEIRIAQERLKLWKEEMRKEGRA